MIITNGYIKIGYNRGDGIDEETGHAVEVSECWGKPVECQFIPKVVECTNLGKSNGEAVKMSKYQILVDENKWKWDSEVICLMDISKRIIGEFSIIWVQHLKAVCETSILV